MERAATGEPLRLLQQPPEPWRATGGSRVAPAGAPRPPHVLRDSRTPLALGKSFRLGHNPFWSRAKCTNDRGSCSRRRGPALSAAAAPWRGGKGPWLQHHPGFPPAWPEGPSTLQPQRGRSRAGSGIAPARSHLAPPRQRRHVQGWLLWQVWVTLPFSGETGKRVPKSVL